MLEDDGLGRCLGSNEVNFDVNQGITFAWAMTALNRIQINRVNNVVRILAVFFSVEVLYFAFAYIEYFGSFRNFLDLQIQTIYSGNQACGGIIGSIPVESGIIEHFASPINIRCIYDTDGINGAYLRNEVDKLQFVACIRI